MKKCPICNRIYEADNVFCQEDGTTLLLISNTGANPPVFPTADNATTQVVSRPQISAQIPVAVVRNDSSKWLFMVIGILATAVVGMGVYMFAARDKEEKKETANQNTKAENSADSGNSVETVVVKNAPTNVPKTNQTIEQPKINPNLNPAGNWSGDWNSTGKFATYFTASVNLTDDGGGKVSGQIVWNLVRTNNPKKVDKVGTSATEYVQGVYNPATRRLSLKGVRKTDPYEIVILDAYNLILAENNLTMNGRSKGGNFSLRR